METCTEQCTVPVLVPDLQEVLIIADRLFVANELEAIAHFPLVWVLAGSPLSAATLLAANVPYCSSCVVISSHNTSDLSRYAHNQYLIDKEALLCTVNVKALPRQLCLRQSHSGSIPDAASIDMERARDRCASESAYDLQLKRLSAREEVAGAGGGSDDASPPPTHINILTELLHAKNGVFLVEGVTRMDEFLTFEGYACGEMFNISLLDFFLSSAFYSPDTLLLVQSIITGGIAEDTSRLFEEEACPDNGGGGGVGRGVPNSGALHQRLTGPLSHSGVILQGPSSTASSANVVKPHNRYRIRQFPVASGPLADALSACDARWEKARLLWTRAVSGGGAPASVQRGVKHAEATVDSNTSTLMSPFSSVTFKDLFLCGLRNLGIVCIGLFRKLDFTDTNLSCSRRFVNPAITTVLNQGNLTKVGSKRNPQLKWNLFETLTNLD